MQIEDYTVDGGINLQLVHFDEYVTYPVTFAQRHTTPLMEYTRHRDMLFQIADYSTIYRKT